MKKENVLFIPILLGIIGIVVISVVSWKAFDPARKRNEIETISNEEARAVAKKNLHYFEAWKAPKLEEDYVFYDMDGNPSAYLFNVSDLYGKAGYITISATTRYEPVVDTNLEVNQSPVYTLLHLTTDLVEGTNYSPNDVKAELLYMGGTEYFARYTFTEGNDIRVRHYKLNADQPYEVSYEELRKKHGFYVNYISETAYDKWEAALK